MVDALRGEHVLAHVVDLVPASGPVEAQDELPGVVDSERVLELVAVAPLGDGGHDRLDRRVLEAPDAREGVAHLRLLLAQLRLVAENLPGRARVRGARLDPVRYGVGCSRRSRLARVS